MKKQSDTLDTTENNENEMQDDEFFEHYLKNQTQLSKQYQQLETPEPSDKLNQAILSASKKQARKNHWWANPGSWAATIAVLSLAGLLTHNTWQNEQNRLQQDIEQQVFSSSRALPASEPKSEARTEAASVGTSEAEKQSATAVPVSSPASFPAKGSFLTDETKDSRKLTFKNAPAPIMSSPSESLRLHSADSDLKKEDISVIQSMSGLKAGEAFNDIPEKKRTLTPSTQQHSETALLPLEWLEKIKYLLQQGRLEEAQKLLYEFQRKYPDYPVDPVILQQLPPY